MLIAIDRAARGVLVPEGVLVAASDQARRRLPAAGPEFASERESGAARVTMARHAVARARSGGRGGALPNCARLSWRRKPAR
jgi:hypothetical protein